MLPIRPYEEPAEPPPPAPRQEAEDGVPWGELPRLDGLSVLVVDDEIDARHIAAAILLQKGAKVAEAGSAEEALDLAARGPFDLIVSDIAMPGTDGYEMMRRLRQRDSRVTPAVALTACVTPDDIATAFSAGYQRYLPKPLGAAALIQTAAELALAPKIRERDRSPAGPSSALGQASPIVRV
jgi:CheY-like chemotaxis protein